MPADRALLAIGRDYGCLIDAGAAEGMAAFGPEWLTHELHTDWAREAFLLISGHHDLLSAVPPLMKNFVLDEKLTENELRNDLSVVAWHAITIEYTCQG